MPDENKIEDDDLEAKAAAAAAALPEDDDEPIDELLTDEERAALGLSDDADAIEEAPAEEDPAVAVAAAAAEDPPVADKAEADPAFPTYDGGADALAKLKADEDAIWTKFNDGELDDAEMRAQLDALVEPRAEIIAQQREAVQQQEKWMDRWADAVGSYKAEHEALFAPEHIEAWDKTVRSITGSDDPDIQALSMRRKLELAHDTYAVKAAALGKEVPSRVTTKSEKVPAPNPQEPTLPAKGEKPKAPVTIRNIPASDAAVGADGKFAALDKIMESGDADAIEAALSRLTPEQRDEYNAAA